MTPKLPQQQRSPIMVRAIASANPIATQRATASMAGKAQIGPTYQFVNLRIECIKCMKTTREVDRDEMILVGIKSEGKLESSGNRMRLAGKATAERIPLGKFQKGDVRRFSDPKLLLQFNLGQRSGEWPRHYAATLLLIEKDEGAIGTIVNAAIKSVEKELTVALSKVAAGLAANAAGVALAAAGAGAAAGSVVPLVGTAVGAAAATATTLALVAIKEARKDDVMRPHRLERSLPQYPARTGEIVGSKRALTFKGAKGAYEAVFSWSVR